MLLRKIKYGCIRLFDEFRGKEDYWHLRLKPIHDLNQSVKYTSMICLVKAIIREK